ncbi:hypothetical protein SDC9_179767 [bioreactor metagenome]|uniref:Uncharacterized protein n=1 Tax=bioreactor metagenome TaxID=1076179 RepID=A0A645H2R9_9ZZZZ
MGHLRPQIVERCLLQRVDRTARVEERVEIDAADNLHPIARILAAKICKLAKALPPANLPDAARRRRRLIFRVCFVHIRPSGGAEKLAHNLGVLTALVPLKHGDLLVPQVQQNVVALRIGVLQFVLRPRARRNTKHAE